MVVLPDTQNLVQNWPQIYYNQMQWIADNHDALNIQAVLHMGDMVNTNNDTQWTVCEAGTDFINAADIPWMPMRGNHDDSTWFNRYYDYETYGTNRSWFGGSYNKDKLDHTYWFVNAGNREYLILSLGWAPSWDVLEWAKGIVEEHDDKSVILVDHAYINKDGTLLGKGDAHCVSSYYSGYPDGDDVWAAFKDYGNVVLAMGGHIHSADVITYVDQNGAGRDVTSLLFDRQDDDTKNRYAMIALLTFHVDSETVDVNWYSTRYDALFRAKNQFSIMVPDVCEHNYTSAIVKPTCTEGGGTKYTCMICGHKYWENLESPLGHSFENDICTTCGLVRVDMTQQFTDWTEGGPVLFSDGWGYGESGYTQGSNKNLKYSDFISVEGINILELTVCARMGNNAGGGYAFYTDKGVEYFISEGTSTRNGNGASAEGTVIHTIAVPEGAKYIRVSYWVDSTSYASVPFSCVGYKTVLPCNHEYTAIVTAPTCTEQGYTTYTCNCGDSYVADYTDPAGHSYGDWYVTTEATCTTKGLESRNCVNCDYYETREKLWLGHVSGTAEILADGEKMIILDDNYVMKNKHLFFSCNVPTLGEGIIRLGHGEKAYSSTHIEITKNLLRVINTSSAVSVNEYEHGILIGGHIEVTVDIGIYAAIVTIKTENGTYKETVPWSGRNGEIFCSTEGVMLYNVDCKWYFEDYNKSVWLFGDSWFSNLSATSWNSYLLKDGHVDVLFAGYGGMGAPAGTAELKRLLQFGKPQYAVFCLGMNNVDGLWKNGGAKKINSTWLAAAEEFASVCKDNGIAPIFALIPSTPTYDNRFKNEWIKNSGYRYIDVENSVVADYESWEWYEDMLTSDQGHTTETGAKAVYVQFLIDFPEIFENSFENCEHNTYYVKAKTADCINAGYSEFRLCTKCGKRFSCNADATEVTAEELHIPATGHSYEETVTPPTVTEQGYTTYTCTVCGDSYKDNFVGITGFIATDDGYYFYGDGEVDTTVNGLTYVEDWQQWLYIEDGKWIENEYSLVEYNGSKFFVANGMVDMTISGLQLIGDNFYYLAYGLLQDQYTGLAYYDGEWFYVEEGVLAIDFNGIQDYDGSKFLIAAGRVLYAYSGLYMAADSNWYFISYGQVQTYYTGLVEYDGAWFYVEEGVLAKDFSGTVEYDGAQFEVVNGGVIFA